MLFADDPQLPGWVQVAGAVVVLIVTPILTVWLNSLRDRAKDALATKTTADLATSRQEHEAEVTGRRETAAEWKGLLEELKTQLRDRRKDHEKDVKRLERDVQILHERTTELERKEERCQETVQELRGKVETLEQKTP